MEKIPEGYRDLLRDEVKAFAFLATTMDDGAREPEAAG